MERPNTIAVVEDTCLHQAEARMESDGVATSQTTKVTLHRARARARATEAEHAAADKIERAAAEKVERVAAEEAEREAAEERAME